MPVYEYSCPKCGEFEVTQRITDDALKRCPQCRRKVKKLISLSAFHLKGTGWYATDYARKENGGKSGASGSKRGSGGAAKATAGQAGSAAAGKKDAGKGANPKAA